MGRSARVAVAYDCLFPYTTGGGERLYRAYARRFAARGWSTDYLTSTQWPNPTPPEDEPFAVVPVAGRFDLYDEGGVRRTSAALRYAFGLFRALRRRRHAYGAVVVSGLPVLNVFAARAALVGSGTPIIVDYLEVWGRRQWIEYAGAATGTIAWILQRLAVVMTPLATAHSELTARALRKEGYRRRVLVSPGLIDADDLSDAEATPAASPPYALYAGRHIPDKRVETLPATIAAVRATIPDMRLIILGTGPSTPAVEAAIASADAADWTDRPGFVSESELAALMGGASVLMNPSRREGYGLVVVEASAYGTPTVLVADEGNAATELIDAGINGLVAASASAPDQASAVVAVMDAGANLRATTRAWYEDAARTRTVERTADAILAAIDDLHDGRPHA